MNIYRIDVYPFIFTDNQTLKNKINSYCTLKVNEICDAKSYILETKNDLSADDLDFIGQEVLSDPIVEDYSYQQLKSPRFTYQQVIQTSFRPGVQDNRANAVKKALQLFFPDVAIQVYSSDLYFFKTELEKSDLEEIAQEFLGNLLLNTHNIFLRDEFEKNRFQNLKTPKVLTKTRPVEVIHFQRPLAELEIINKERVWALSRDELKVIQDHFQKKETIKKRESLGLGPDPTDVEIEIIAQTWSEHCKHKIFSADIEYQEENHSYKKLGSLSIQGLYKTYIKNSTREIQEERKLDWLISVFSDNAGIVRFDESVDLCIKVETHNSPSALDPYGGALTGILGVNRDILGTGMGARPIANMDVFCFADEDILNRAKLPKGLLHPRRILEGVHKGVEDGGNKSGIPTINGSIFFDDHYVGKPLVYVGTVGVMPQSTQHYPKTSEKNYKINDRIVMVGGRIGKDGIHGATFSSMELNESSPATAVQIGDPFTQKKVTDFMLKAMELGLYSGITDNGAGGLSSSIGEMAQKTGGAQIDLAKAPVKYDGLSVYELMISESQERMTFAVAPEHLDQFIELAHSMEVEATDLGFFTDSGFLEVFYEDKLHAALEMHFLHEGLPAMKLTALFDPQNNPFQFWHQNGEGEPLHEDMQVWLKKLLARPNIRSKESLVRQYDHEVQASSITKPFTGSTQSGPSDAGVISLKASGGSGHIAIGNGNQPLYSRFDPYLMAIHSVDEALRNVVASGGDPNKLVLLDNFCWPDPLPSQNNPDAAHKLAGLVRANRALYESCKIHGTPLVSGKDSMKNDFSGLDGEGNPIKISVPPTLLVTSMAKIENEDWITCTDFKQKDDLIYLLGEVDDQKLHFCEFSRAFQIKANVKSVESQAIADAKKIYDSLHQSIRDGLIESCHDISEGGLITALCESCFGNTLGAKLELSSTEIPLLVNEAIALMLVSVKQENHKDFEMRFEHRSKRLGKTTHDFSLSFQDGVNISLDEMMTSWRGDL